MESLMVIEILILTLIIIIYFFFWKSRTACNKREPPQARGSWPIIGHLHLLAGSQPPHITLGNLADKYGPIFTINLGVHKTLVVSSSEMAKECLATNDKTFASRPNSIAAEILGYDYSMLGFSPYGEYWRQIRKIVTLQLLSNHRIDTLKHVRESEVKTAIKWLYDESISNKSGFIQMNKWFLDITLNVILKIIVGKRYVEEYNKDINGFSDGGDDWKNDLREFMELSGKFSVSDAVPFLRWLDLGGVEKDMKKTAKNLDIAVAKWLEERKQNKEDKEDFMSVLLSFLDSAEELSSQDANTINKATCLALILAASDTTAITLTWALSLLLNNHYVLEKAQHELDINVGRERQVKESDTKNLVYLQAIIKESFRLYPAVPLSLPHESIEDSVVNGYHIPSGTQLLVNISKIQKDPCLWPNPERFEPERFLTIHKEIDLRGQNFELIPFSSGRRICPAISFALRVLTLTLATLLHSFEIKTLSLDPIDMTEGSGITNVKATPVEVVLTPRLVANLY